MCFEQHIAFFITKNQNIELTVKRHFFTKKILTFAKNLAIKWKRRQLNV